MESYKLKQIKRNCDYANGKLTMVKQALLQIAGTCELVSPTLTKMGAGDASYLDMNKKQLQSLVESREEALYHAASVMNMLDNLVIDLDGNTGHIVSAIADIDTAVNGVNACNNSVNSADNSQGGTKNE